jgi:hypothetical protein
MTRPDTPHDPTDDPLARPEEPGAYVGNRPERQAETIPGGVRPGDERIAAHSTEAGATSDLPATGERRPPAPRRSS